jgi:hypothetical protein
VYACVGARPGAEIATGPAFAYRGDLMPCDHLCDRTLRRTPGNIGMLNEKFSKRQAGLRHSDTVQQVSSGRHDRFTVN